MFVLCFASIFRCAAKNSRLIRKFRDGNFSNKFIMLMWYGKCSFSFVYPSNLIEIGWQRYKNLFSSCFTKTPRRFHQSPKEILMYPHTVTLIGLQTKSFASRRKAVKIPLNPFINFWKRNPANGMNPRQAKVYQVPMKTISNFSISFQNWIACCYRYF